MPPFVPLDPSLCPIYPTRTKGLHPLILRNYTSHIPRYVYLVPKQPIVPPPFTPHTVANQFPTVVLANNQYG